MSTNDRATVACGVRRWLVGLLVGACTESPPRIDVVTDVTVPDAATVFDVTSEVDLDETSHVDGPEDATVMDVVDASQGGLDATRTRLLGTYLTRLRMHPDVMQSNGLRGRDLTDVCDLWSRLTPSARAVFLTLTARLAGTILANHGEPAIEHVTALHRIAGGEGATERDVGSCGGGEWNRLMLSMDPTLHAAFVAAIDRRGARRSDGRFDLAGVRMGTAWRESRDLAGPHRPFTRSAETDEGAPRAQVHFFRDPTAAAANVALGRRDVETLVDPMALEIDHDYDCAHASNPLCRYTFYGPACLPATPMLGVALYAARYGAIDLTWRPLACAARDLRRAQ